MRCGTSTMAMPGARSSSPSDGPPPVFHLPIVPAGRHLARGALHDRSGTMSATSGSGRLDADPAQPVLMEIVLRVMFLTWDGGGNEPPAVRDPSFRVAANRLGASVAASGGAGRLADVVEHFLTHSWGRE